MAKPKILFFARGYQAEFYPALASDRYDAVFVTLTAAEKRKVETRGVVVSACFEDDYAQLPVADVPENYLLSALFSDRFLGRFDHAKRREILGKEIAFWAALLDFHKPDIVTNELIAIEISEVLLIETRKRGIPYLAALNCVVDDWFYWLPDPISLSGRHLVAPEPTAKSMALATQYFETLMAKTYSPFYVQNLDGRRALLPIVKGIVRFGLGLGQRIFDRLSGAFRYESYSTDYARRLAVFAKSFIHRYDRLDDIPEAREIIFYPLHQEPEATLLYMSEYYANQVATIENILKSLTENQVLVVKEHPVDKGSLLLEKFWQLRRQYSGLYYLPAEVHGRQVLARAARVVTLTSTVGWEAAALGKPVYVLGQIFYDDLPGLKRLPEIGAIKAKLRAPVDPADIADRAALIRFVAQSVEQSYRGNPFPHDKLYDAENLHRVGDALLSGIKHR